MNGFLREIYRILPILGVHEFDAVTNEGIDKRSAASPVLPKNDARDTIIVPAREEGFAKVFLGENSWYYIRIGGGMLPKIKYIAAYQSAPISAVTHYAPVERIEPYGDGRKFRVIFAQPAKPLGTPIPFAGAAAGSMQGIRYTQLSKLLTAKKVTELFDMTDD